MKRDRKRLSGFYWVRFEGQVIVAEYTADGLGCSPEGPHWHVPQSEGCHSDREIRELLSGKLVGPDDFLLAVPILSREATEYIALRAKSLFDLCAHYGVALVASPNLLCPESGLASTSPTAETGTQCSEGDHAR